MDSLQINFEKLIPYAIEAFTAIYGEGYHDMIEEKLNNLTIFDYLDVDGTESYIWHLKEIKSKELSLKFLDYLGYDVKKDIESKKYYNLRNDVNDLLKKYLGSCNLIFDNDINYHVLLKAFEKSNPCKQEKILINKVNLINNFLKEKGKSITLAELDDFCKTDEFAIISSKIKKALIIYNNLEKEYRNWTKQFEAIEEYVKAEKDRKRIICDSKKEKMVTDVNREINPEIKRIINNWNIEEKWNLLFEITDEENVCIIENFRQDKIDLLSNPLVDLTAKYWIMYWQIIYFEKLGIKFPNNYLNKCIQSGNLDKYINWLNKEKTKQLIPNPYLINHVTSLNKRMKEKIERQYFTSKKDFKRIYKLLNSQHYTKDMLYTKMKDKKVCIIENSNLTKKVCSSGSSIMFFTIRVHDGGQLAHIFMHECGHAIDQGENRNGFECFDDEAMNPYNPKYRKYERFNETLNDILTLEANSYLISQGIFLIENEELLSNDIFNRNTRFATKQIVYPLLLNFREQLIKAKVTASPMEFIKLIGRDNFENLVDILNKVDYLTQNGMEALKENPKLEKEYLRELDKLNDVYNSIDFYYKNNFGEETYSI
mgnify:FL=1